MKWLRFFIYTYIKYDCVLWYIIFINSCFVLFFFFIGDLEAVSQRLVCYAKSHGSTDNISAIVVFLTNPCQIAARHPSAHPLLADVQLNNMEPTNPFLSNANNGLQFDINSFGKQQQQEQQQQQQQQSPRNGTCPDLKNEEDVWYEGFRNPPPSNGKISSIDEIGTNFQKEYEKSPKENNGDEEDDDDDDDEDDDLGPETDVDAVDLGFDLSNQQINENLSRELFPEKHEHGELIETKEEEETTSKDDKVVAPLQPKGFFALTKFISDPLYSKSFSSLPIVCNVCVYNIFEKEKKREEESGLGIEENERALSLGVIALCLILPRRSACRVG